MSNKEVEPSQRALKLKLISVITIGIWNILCKFQLQSSLARLFRDELIDNYFISAISDYYENEINTENSCQ